MNAQTHDLLMRVAEAVRSASAKAALGDAHIDARGGRNEAARERNGAAWAVGRIDIAAIVADVAELAPNLAEDEAFNRAAHANQFNTMPGSTDGFAHPITARARAVWQAGVRWARLNPEPPS